MSLWGIASFFNPSHSRRRTHNLNRWFEGMRTQGLRLILNPEAGGSVCWQKERLLNAALKALPPDCDKVAWLDTDILFLNDGWVAEAERLLDQYPLIQLFDTVVSDGKSSTGIVVHHERTKAKEGRTVREIGNPINTMFGRTGYAWAARREILDYCGFYDKCIVGGGDAVMAFAAYGLAWPGENEASDRFTPEHLADIAAWRDKFYARVQGNVGFVPGTILHMDHGSQEGRAYETRTEILTRNHFTPDDVTESGGPWLWATDKPQLHSEVAAYFEGRAD